MSRPHNWMRVASVTTTAGNLSSCRDFFSSLERFWTNSRHASMSGCVRSVRGVEENRAAARASARGRILDAAVKLIAREGIHDIRIARIAMEAGGLAAFLHYHLASPDPPLARALEPPHQLARGNPLRAQGGTPAPPPPP